MPDYAMIKPGDATYYSKFKIEGVWTDPVSEIKTPWTLNINSDVVLPKFWTVGADKKPKPERQLEYTSLNSGQFVGFERFSGSIGDGRFYLRTEKGVVFKGAIKCGPDEGQTFTGSGTWLKG